jgi:ABC-type phosphate/phosphonate transport system substrate-binding protein
VGAATADLREALAASLIVVGWQAAAEATAFRDHDELEAHWLDERVALTHSCGLPIHEALSGRVTVLGTFLWGDVTDWCGRYRSVIVVRADEPAGRLDELVRPRPAVNDGRSLSGWASLGAALAAAGHTAPLPATVVTGAHTASLAAVVDGRADVAAIDAVTFALLKRYRPAAVREVRVLARGPVITATPLVSRASPPISLRALRSAVEACLREPDLAPALETLGITGFVPVSAQRYAPAVALAAVAESVLPRR